MGQIAGQLVDWVVITDDNSRNEKMKDVRFAFQAGHIGNAGFPRDAEYSRSRLHKFLKLFGTSWW